MPNAALNWMVGGPQGSGVDSAANLFALSVARAGLHVVGQREYYSNIMGKHSYYKIRAAEHPVHASSDAIHLLATYDEETLVRHIHSQEVVEGGAVLYAKGCEDKEIARITNLDRSVKERIAAELAEAGYPVTVGGSIELARKRGLHVLGLPFEALLDDVAKEIGVDSGGKLHILKNTIAVGASLGLLGLPASYVDDTVRYIFANKGEKVHEMNIVAARIASEFATGNIKAFKFRMPHGHDPGKRVWMNGTQAVALAKVVAGCRVHTYYPISPATDEATYLEANPDSDVVVVQTEDEIAAATMALGAALTGARASTSTSGPGFCLMVEAIGWAGMCEVPVVIVNYQRGGPSTGLPTRTEQGDLQFALRLGHGDFPRIVMSSGDIEELFYDTLRAFEWADRYQTPVIMLPDKAIAGNSRTIEPFDLTALRIDRGRLASPEDVAEHGKDGKFPRYGAAADGISTRTILGQPGGIHWLTGDEHTRSGHITEDPTTRDAMMVKRAAKLARADAEIPAEVRATLHGPSEADVTLVAWGSTKGAILEAMALLEELSINFLQYRVMSPFPMATAETLQRAKRLICIEENQTGQLRDLITQCTTIRIPHLVTKTNGRPTMPQEVVEAVRRILKEDAPEVVMAHGV
jgi:2-oxoglutarate/2-oxoacid ferredoxin oxidoreductase subunit alpha